MNTNIPFQNVPWSNKDYTEDWPWFSMDDAKDWSCADKDNREDFLWSNNNNTENWSRSSKDTEDWSLSNKMNIDNWSLSNKIDIEDWPWSNKDSTEDWPLLNQDDTEDVSGFGKDTMDYIPRKEDIIVASYPRTGTNWLHNIVLQVTSKGTSLPSFNNCFCSEVSFMETTIPKDNGETNGLRVYKNHYGYDKVQKDPESKVIYIYRNPEDTLISWYHFLRYHYREKNINLDEFIRRFLAGNVEYGSYFDHVLSYLAHKDDSNLLLVSYEKLHSNTREEILRIAEFLDEKYHEILSDDESLLGKVMENSSFGYMENNIDMIFCQEKLSRDLIDDVKKLRMNIFRLGAVGDGKRSLSLDQQKIISEKVSETMRDTEVFNEWISVISV